MTRTYRVRVGFVLEYETEAEAAIEVHQAVAAARDAGVDLDGAGSLWAGPDLISIEVVPA